MKIELDITPNELNEVVCKLANELETYGDSASSGLIDGFLKLADQLYANGGPTYETTLMKKWYRFYKSDKNSSMN